MFRLLNNIKNKAMVGKTQIFLNCAIHTHAEETPSQVLLNCQNNWRRLARCVIIYQITRSKRDILCAAVSRTFKFYIVASL